MKLIINVETDTLTISFSNKFSDEIAFVKPGIIVEYAPDGKIGAIEIQGLSKHLAGGKVHAMELDLDPDHSDTHFEVEFPERAQKHIAKILREAASKPEPDFKKIKLSELKFTPVNL